MKNWYVNETKEHLQGLADILNKNGYPTEVDEADYASIAFDLILVSEGDKEALKRVSEFIQSEHARLKTIANSFNNFRDNTHNWLKWAENWTQRKQEVSNG